MFNSVSTISSGQVTLNGQLFYGRILICEDNCYYLDGKNITAQVNKTKGDSITINNYNNNQNGGVNVTQVVNENTKERHTIVYNK